MTDAIPSDAENLKEPGITLGIEEELFLVDPASRDLLADPDPDILEACGKNRSPHKVVPEFLRSQIETNTRVCASVAEVREALCETRRIVIETAEAHGAAVMAASTHPFATWQTQVITPKARYEQFAVTYQESMRRVLLTAMHVHAGFGGPDSRVRVMTALRRHLPLLHALSTSSPFHAGSETGFKSWRLNLLGVLPRTSVPGPLGSRADYERLVEDYRRIEVVKDGSEVWWDIRPSHVHPTVELRICDTCARIDDAVSIVALYASLIRRLMRLDAEGALPPDPPTELIAENRWLAQRYGVLAFLGDVVRGGRMDIEEYAAALVEQLVPDARALDCEAELRHTLTIIREGSGADRQVDFYRLRRLEGDTHEEALRRVVDMVLAETREGVF